MPEIYKEQQPIDTNLPVTEEDMFAKGVLPPSVPADEIQAIRAEMKRLSKQAFRDEEQSLIDKIYRDPIPIDESLPITEEDMFDQWERRPEPEHQDAPLSVEHPFETIVDFDDVATPVYVRHGAFMWLEGGELQFAGTDGSDSATAFATSRSLYNPDTFSAGSTIYATLDKSGTTPDANLATSALATEDDDHISIVVAHVSAAGAVQQFITEHIMLGFESGQLDHSFLPVKTSETQFSIPKGRVRVGNEVASTALPGTATGLTIGTNYYIKVDWYDTYFRAPNVT